MKLQPLSADLVVKVALLAAAIGAAWWVQRTVRDAAGQAIDGAAAWADNLAHTTLNPASSANVVNRGVSAIGAAVVSDTGPGRNADGSWTLGGWFYDVTH